MRICVLTTNSCQHFWRSYLPVVNCAPLLANEGIELHLCNKPSLDYDAYLIHVMPPRELWPFLEMIKQYGKKLVWHTDDDVFRIPEHNPASKYIDKSMMNWLHDNADELWVSTTELYENLGGEYRAFGNIKILPNLIDTRYWPTVNRTDNEEVRLIWAGSAYHQMDLELIANCFDKLLAKYDNIFCLFMGSWPASLSEWVVIPGSNQATQVPHNRYKGKLGYINPVNVERYPHVLASINADIGIAAITDEPFNFSKSNLKWLEYSMLGIPTAASDLPPYQGTTSLLGDLYYNCCQLIEDEKFRKVLGHRSHKEVLANWTWDGPQKDIWLDAYRQL